MLSEYNRMIQSYNDQKQQKVQDDKNDITNLNRCSFGNNKNEIQSKSSRLIPRTKTTTTTTPHSNNDDPQEDNALEINFLNELKTSQLKAVQEQSLISMFQRIMCIHNDSIGALRSSLYESKQVNKSYENLVKRLELEIGEVKEEKESMTSKIELLEVESKDLESDLLLCRKESNKANEKFENEKAELLRKNQIDMDAFLVKMDNEVEIVKTSMKEETTSMIEEVKSALKSEQDEELNRLHDKISKLEEENKMYQVNQSIQETKMISKLDELNAIIEEDNDKLKEIEERLKSSEERRQNQEITIKDLHKSIEEEKKSWHDKLSAQIRDKEEELKVIEQKVKEMIHSKDEKIKKVTKRACNAEKREKELEQFIENIEHGFTEKYN